MHADRLLPPGQPLSLHLAAGDELVCTAGLLRLMTTGPWLEQAWAPPAQQLATGQTWRASADLWVRLESVRPASRFRCLPAPRPAQLPETTDAGRRDPCQPHTPASSASLASRRPARAA
jgi:hypothetical protein